LLRSYDIERRTSLQRNVGASLMLTRPSQWLRAVRGSNHPPTRPPAGQARANTSCVLRRPRQRRGQRDLSARASDTANGLLADHLDIRGGPEHRFGNSIRRHGRRAPFRMSGSTDGTPSRPDSGCYTILRLGVHAPLTPRGSRGYHVATAPGRRSGYSRIMSARDFYHTISSCSAAPTACTSGAAYRLAGRRAGDCRDGHRALR